MKLIDCDISAFGALVNKHIDFSEGITTILEQNGFGKTTLSAFIKAMFYSMPTARKNQGAESSERAKYYPWSGGNFGGRLTFEANGKRYRIIRSFDRYSAASDSFTLVDAVSGKPSDDYSSDIGQELFGIDESGFARSTFSNGEVSLSSLPISIRNKISTESQSADDMDEFDRASSRLSVAIKEIEGRGGILESCEKNLQRAKSELERLKTEAMEYERVNALVSELTKKAQQLEITKKELSESLKMAQGKEANRLRLEGYNAILEEIEELKANAKQIYSKYNGSLPTDELYDRLENEVSRYNRLAVLLSAEREKLSSQSFREVLSLFENSLPSDEQMGSIDTQIKAIDRFKNSITELENKKNELEKELCSLHIENVENIPSEQQLLALRTANAEGIKVKKSKSTLALGIIAVAAMLAGAGLIFIKYTIAGIAALAVGAVMLISAILIVSVKKIVLQSLPTTKNSVEAVELLKKHGFSKDCDINLAIDTLKDAVNLKEEILKCEQKAAEQKNALSKALEICWEFMDSYAADRSGDIELCFDRLSKLRDRYINEAAVSREAEDNLKKECDLCKRGIFEILSPLGFKELPADTQKLLSQIKEDIYVTEKIKKELNEAQVKAAESFEQNEIEKLSSTDFEGKSVEEIAKSLEQADSLLLKTSKEIIMHKAGAQKLMESIEAQNEVEEQIQRDSETQSSAQKKLEFLKLTKELLKEAKDSLSEKYSQGIKDSFEKYSSLFLNNPCSGAEIDSELEVSIQKEGMRRSAFSLSSGQQGVLDVCLRLSLIDAMFQKEKPFLLLDDPFLALDQSNLSAALELIKSVSKSLQIIYLTCHQSRQI